MKKLILFIVIIYIAGCNNDIQNTQNIDLINTTKRTTLLFSHVFSDYNFIQLETTDESIIGYIDKLIVKGRFLYFLSQNAILIFDNNGQFIRKVNKKGKGEGEYLSIADFYVNSKGNIIILDNHNKKILYYTIEGNPIKQVKNDYLFLAKSFIFIDNNVIALFGDTGWANDYRFIILDIEKNKLLGKYFFIDKKYRKYQHVFGGSNFFKRDSIIYTTYAFNDTIYKIKKDYSIEPAYKITHKYPVPNNFYFNDFSDIRDFGNKASKYNYFNASFLSNNKLVYFTFRGEGKKFNRFACYYYFDKDTCFTTNEYVDDIYTGAHLYLNKGFSAISITNNNIYYAIEASNFINWFNSTSSFEGANKQKDSILNLIHNIDVNQNPLLMIAKIK